MITCDRCGDRTNIWIMSIFNEDQICGSCKEEERNHPSYKLAKDVERSAVLRGDYNFPGIGKPADL